MSRRRALSAEARGRRGCRRREPCTCTTSRSAGGRRCLGQIEARVDDLPARSYRPGLPLDQQAVRSRPMPRRDSARDGPPSSPGYAVPSRARPHAARRTSSSGPRPPPARASSCDAGDVVTVSWRTTSSARTPEFVSPIDTIRWTVAAERTSPHVLLHLGERRDVGRAGAASSGPCTTPAMKSAHVCGAPSARGEGHRHEHCDSTYMLATVTTAVQDDRAGADQARERLSMREQEP